MIAWRHLRVEADTPHVLHRLPQRDATLVFGMDWHTILGGQLAAEARRRAAAARATHLVHAGPNVESVGTARLKRVPRGAKLYAAAQLFARLHPTGVALACLPLSDDAVWVVGVRDGVVMARTDVVHASMDAAHEALHALRMQEPDALCYGAAETSMGPVLDIESLAAQLVPHAALQVRPRAWAAVPRPLLVLLALCVIVPVVQRGWQSHQAREHRAAAAALAAAMPEPSSAWRERDEAHLGALLSLAHEDLGQALDTLGQMPLNVAGWRFDGARCEPDSAHGWRCEAMYQRGDFSASNAGFAAAADPQWRNLWAPFDQVNPTFVQAIPRRPLRLADLPTVSAQQLQAVSALQTLRAAFSQAELGRAEPLAISGPIDPNGNAVPRPAGASVPMQQRLRLQGPMRSLYALAEQKGPYRWSRLTLAVDPATRPTLKLSALMATLEGALYAYGD